MAFRVLATDQRPDFRTRNDFRKQYLSALADLFVQALTLWTLCERVGLVTLGHIALDETKLKANSSKHTAIRDRRPPQSPRSELSRRPSATSPIPRA